MKLALGVIEVVTRLQSQFRVRLFHSPKLIDPLSPWKAANNTITLKNLTYTRKSNEQEIYQITIYLYIAQMFYSHWLLAYGLN